MRKFYRLLSKHKHDVPDYKCNYKIILDSWENVPQLCYARVCSLREKEVKKQAIKSMFGSSITSGGSSCLSASSLWLSASTPPYDRRRLRKLLPFYTCDSKAKITEEKEARTCALLFLKSLPESLTWHNCLYLICQNLVHGHKLQRSLGK